MTGRTRVALYARISQDRTGAGLGVARQIADCRAEAERLGWTVAEEYADDDVSAFSGKRRPAYERMLADIASGQRDAVLAWHIDRLHRRPIELEHLADVCSRAGVTDLRTVHGSFDLTTGDGMFVARLLSAVAANESDAKRRRGQRKMLEIAQAGQPHGGGTRPFGFLPDRVTHDPAEAPVIRELAARAIAGESLVSLSRWLDANEVRTVTGRPWRTATVRNLLLNPRLCGLRVHRGDVIGPAAWEPIITPEQSERLRALLTDPARRTNRSARTYLLSGMCRCALCGSTMLSVPRFDVRRYLCRSGIDFGGCGRMALTAEPAEQIIREAVLIRLDSPALDDALAGRVRDDQQASDLRAAIAADTEQLTELADLYAQRAITGPEWLEARATIEQRREQARTRLARLAGTDLVQPLVGQGETLRRTWPDLDIQRRRAIIRTVLDHVQVHPARRGAQAVAVDRLEPIWRL